MSFNKAPGNSNLFAGESPALMLPKQQFKKAVIDQKSENILTHFARSIE
jgi:hypothetical protein